MVAVSDVLINDISDVTALRALSAAEVVALAVKLAKKTQLKAPEVNAVAAHITVPSSASNKELKIKHTFARTL